MRVAAGSILLLTMGLGASAAWVVAVPRGASFFAEARARDLATVPDPARRLALERHGHVLGGSGRSEAARSVLALVVIRLSCAVTVLPLLAMTGLLGVLIGLLRRHRLREAHGFASLTFSYLGKMMVGASLSMYAFVAISPVAPPLWMLYAAALATATGAALFAGNLPPKI